MKKGRGISRDEIVYLANSAVGYSINELADKELIVLDKKKLSNKGGVGQIIENLLFGIKNNSDSEPDFMPAHIELKVTPYKHLKNGEKSAKERLVLNIINYEEEYKNSFESSHFYFKNKNIELMWYLWEPNVDNKDLKITKAILLELDKNPDLKQIKKDWQFIVDKIKAGKAHELSEADTMYLGACTKGANANSLRVQPSNSIKAMQRAFCFKTSYMTQLVRKYFNQTSEVESVLSNSDLLLEDYVKKVVNKFKGYSFNELKEKFELNGTTKDDFSRIINRMFNLKRGLEDSDEFIKANIIPKTIRVEEDGKVIEHMSFPAFKFKELALQTWETSEFREQLETTKYMFFIFRKKDNEYYFDGYKLWNMPENIINTVVYDFWNKVVNIINHGVEFEIKNGRVFNNLPGPKDNGYVHIRPHANNKAYKLKDGFSVGNIKKDGDKLPNGEWMTKQCFWFNNELIRKIINGENYE